MTPHYVLRADAERGPVVAEGPDLDAILDAAGRLLAEGRSYWLYDGAMVAGGPHDRQRNLVRRRRGSTG